MLILATILLLLQQPKVVTCTVIEPGQSVACPEGGKMVLFRFDDATEAQEIFSEWGLVAPLQNGTVNSDVPLLTKVIKAGDKVKAEITDAQFRPVAECHVRVYRRKKAWREQREGERPPGTLDTLPDDCQPWYGRK